VQDEVCILEITNMMALRPNRQELRDGAGEIQSTRRDFFHPGIDSQVYSGSCAVSPAGNRRPEHNGSGSSNREENVPGSVAAEGGSVQPMKIQRYSIVPSRFARTLSGLVVLLLVAGLSRLSAQTPRNRVLQAINPNSAIALPGTVNPHVAARYDAGRLGSSTSIGGITLYFQPTPTQQAELDALVKAQETPGSLEYHQWLTPAEYADRFGLSNADLNKIESWIESRGFNIDRVSHSHTSITFSGTAEQVESAFQTEMREYRIDGKLHFANASEISIPAALAGVVQSVRNLNDFRPRPQLRFHAQSASIVTPAFTTSGGEHFLTPKDIGTIYDIDPAYSAGYTGTGQSIAVVGQSSISVSDIENFQKAAGLTVQDPTLLLVPNSGTAAVSSGDEAESDLDLEYSGGIGRGANIYFVYVGNSPNYSVFDALQYAIDNKLSPVISISYGTCETEMSSSSYSTMESILEQGASQGQSIIAASGDEGSTDCFYPQGKSGLTTAQQEALAVNYPASSAYATGLGGTEFPAGDVSPSNSDYWESSSGSDVVPSALSYIPEGVWNDDNAAFAAQYGADAVLSSGGGGVSVFTPRPSWQTEVPGIASGGYRLVPDLSLDSSAINAGYLYCTSDSSVWSGGQKASCNSGFRDSSSGDFTIAGGTSFATPIFAGMLAIINQKSDSTGQGVVNATLYSLAANASTYASAFHDITSGSNKCTAGSTYCSTAGQSGFSATTGYDEASGLGSVDFENLMTVWPGGSSTSTGGAGPGGTFTLAAGNISVAQGGSGTSTVTVNSQNSFAGTVSLTLTGGNSSLASYGCYTVGNATLAAGGTDSGTLTVYTSQSACSSASGVHSFFRAGTARAASRQDKGRRGDSIPVSTAALAGVLFFGFRRFRKNAWTLLSCALLVLLLGFSVGCGGSAGTAATSSSSSPSSTGSTATVVSAGTYTLTLTGADTADSSIAASTTLTLTVQ
jgi:subtilase family serine protease